MNKRKFNSLTLFLSAFFALGFLCSCSKDDPPGKETFMESKFHTITESGWTWNSIDLAYQATILENNITSEVINSGAVLVYAQAPNGGWNLCPLTFYVTSTVSGNIQTNVLPGRVNLLCFYSTRTAFSDPGAFNFKVVVLTGKELKAHPGVDFADFEKVCEVFEK